MRGTGIFFLMLLIIGSGLFIRLVLINFKNQSNTSGKPGQIDRVELMPNLPEPFHMRDWNQVARDYDDLVFNFSKTGTYLPLISWDYSYWNFDRETFSMPSYVGKPMADEAINCMAAVLSATLVGIDKSNQSGYNWIEMCENWYNVDTEQYIYLNNRHALASTSYWYVLFPNLIFYQLAYYYPETGDFQNEILGVADRWYDACVALGGSVDPRSVPNFAHTAFDFDTMQSVYHGHREPDAAAAIAWLEYIAYLKENNSKYLLAAEWCLEFLSQLTYNPLYEVLLPYGAYIAARMNAEMGKTYNTRKIINWCFGIGDHQARYGWGVIAQNWGGYDCHGLHGSITDGGGYAFAMGTYDNVGCMVPIVRYDDRYARAIGKYVLNAANAARLFFGNGLDAAHQDSEDWIEAYDPNYCIGYEGLRKTWGGISPLATGDVNRDRYQNQIELTNLGLYGSSHVGNLGGIIASTNDEKILQLDCLVTDYYHDEAYPTYLYYNPYDVTKMVKIDVGLDLMSLYDTTTEKFLATNVSGLISFQLPADSAVVVVVVPADGIITYEGTKTLINNITVDYEPIIKDTSITQTESSPFPNFFLILGFYISLVCFSRRKRNT